MLLIKNLKYKNVKQERYKFEVIFRLEIVEVELKNN